MFTLFRTMHAVKFLFTAPFLVAFLFFVNLMTGGPWWFQWAALGIAFAWVINLFRVIRAVIVMGGIAALAAYLLSRTQGKPSPVVDLGRR
jgi:hypothetical protein